MSPSHRGRIITWTLIVLIYCLIQIDSATANVEIELGSEFALPPPHPTYRAKRQNCTLPAIEQFPRPFMPPQWRKSGGLIIDVLIVLFSFLGLAIVCDEYFVSSLSRMCKGIVQGYILLFGGHIDLDTQVTRHT